MSKTQIWQESLTGRFAARAGLTWRQSGFCRWVSGTAQYSRQEAVRSSLTSRAPTAVAGFLVRPLEQAGAAIRRGLPGSLCLNLRPHPSLSSSIFLRSVAGFRVETLLWLVFSYIFIDYALRRSPSTAFWAGNWDELLLVLIFLAWPLQMALRGKLTYRLTPLDFPIFLYLAVEIGRAHV